jgi:hypothetical protein
VGSRHVKTLAALTSALVAALVLAPSASASTGSPITPVAFLGLPSLQEIIDAIAKGFFGALARALVPDFLKHGTVATIQHLVALPDPAQWGHVGQLQGDMVYLGALLLPISLAVGTVRYWMLGFSGAAHPAGAVGRSAGATGVLVAYRWIVEQVVAATNTLTHAILGLPVVGSGLQRIIAVLFGGALLTGTGGVFGAFLVIVGVIFAAGLFALQVLLTVVLAVLIVCGPPLIALSAIPELSHLAHAWGHSLLTLALVPLGWTVLFATAGALSLDATSFTAGAGSLPAHIAAAFAGLITFVLAVKLPLMLLGELRHLFGAASFSGRGSGSARSALPGAERVRAANARLRSAALEGVPALGASVGLAAGALGAPAGGPIGAARRRLGAVARLGGLPRSRAAADGVPPPTAAVVTRRGRAARARRGARERVTRAGLILAAAPHNARAAMARGSRAAVAHAPPSGASPASAPTASTSTSKHAASVLGAWPESRGGERLVRPRSATPPRSEAERAGDLRARGPASADAKSEGGHPGRKLASAARREADSPPTKNPSARRPSAAQPPRAKEGREQPPSSPRPPEPRQPKKPNPVRRRPRPRGKP